MLTETTVQSLAPTCQTSLSGFKAGDIIRTCLGPFGLPQQNTIGWVAYKKQKRISQFQMLGSPRSRRQQIWCLVRSCFLVHRWMSFFFFFLPELPFDCVFTWQNGTNSGASPTRALVPLGAPCPQDLMSISQRRCLLTLSPEGQDLNICIQEDTNNNLQQNPTCRLKRSKILEPRLSGELFPSPPRVQLQDGSSIQAWASTKLTAETDWCKFWSHQS